MKWNAISASADILAAIGVIISLVYLALQVRASNKASAVNSKSDAAIWYSGFLKFSLENPELDELLYRGRKGLDHLKKGESRQFHNFILFVFSGHSDMYFRYAKQ